MADFDNFEEDSARSSESERDLDEESERGSIRETDSPIFRGSPDSDTGSDFDYDPVQETPTADQHKIIPLGEEDMPDFVQPIRLVPRRDVSPADKTIIDSIIEYYKSLQIKDFDPEEIYNMAKSERYAIASEIEIIPQMTREIIDINIPTKRILPHEQRMHITRYEYDMSKIQPLFETRLFRVLSALNPTYPHLNQLASHITGLILNSEFDDRKKVEIMGQVLFQLDGNSAAREAREQLNLNYEEFHQLEQFLANFRTNIFIHPGLVLNNKSYIRGGVGVPDVYLRQFNRHRKSVKQPLLVPPPGTVLELGDETLDTKRLKDSITRALTDLLIKIYLLSQPEEREEYIINAMAGCDIITNRNCSKEIVNIIRPYKDMAQYINNQIYNKYNNVDDYLARIAILFLHLNRDTPLGYYSTKFQYEIFKNPNIAISGVYENDIYPPLFRSSEFDKATRDYLWVFAQDEIQDEYKNLKRSVKEWQGLRLPLEIETRHIQRLHNQSDVERLLGNRYKDQYDIKRGVGESSEPTESPVDPNTDKIYSVTFGDKSYTVTATKNPPDLLFGEEEFYMIRYLPNANSYIVLKFKQEDDESWTGSIIGVNQLLAKNIQKKLRLDLNRSMELDEVMDTFGNMNFYVVKSKEFEESPAEYALVFSRRLNKSFAPKPLPKTSTIKPTVKANFNVDELLRTMGGKVY